MSSSNTARLVRGLSAIVILSATPPAARSLRRRAYGASPAAHASFTVATDGSEAAETDPPSPRANPLQLSDLEQQVIALGPTMDLNAVQSALLRRYSPFRKAERLSIEPGSACLRIEWDGGPTAPVVDAILAHPVTGRRRATRSR